MARIKLDTPEDYAKAMLCGSTPLRTIVRQIERQYGVTKDEAWVAVGKAQDARLAARGL